MNWKPLKQGDIPMEDAACQNRPMPGRSVDDSPPLDPEQLYLYQGGNEMKAEAVFHALSLLFSSGFEGPAKLVHDTLEATTGGTLRMICRESCELETDGRLIELLHPTPPGARTR